MNRLETARDIVRTEKQIDALLVLIDSSYTQLDVLTRELETKRQLLAFQNTKYTPEESRPVRFMEIA
jgi:hypothetical protein